MKLLVAVAAVLVALGVGGYVWFSTQFVTGTVRGMDWRQVDAETVDEALIAETGAGRIAGSRHPAGPVQFRSIPFAKAPVGDLRWAAPRPAESWSGALDARRPAPRCLQPMSFAGKWPGGQSEDCLWLSVWTPAVDDDARPVVVWVHGGGLWFGGAGETVYDGGFIAARGDVVVIGGDETELEALADLIRDHALARRDEDIYLDVLTAGLMFHPHRMLADEYGANGAPVYYYLFDWHSPLFPELGAFHALDLPFMFGTLDDDASKLSTGDDAPRELSEDMVDAVTSFARTGQPAVPGLPAWPPEAPESRPAMVFSVPSRLVEDPLPWLSDFSALFEESLTKQEAAPTNDTKGVGRHGLLAF